MVVAIQLYAIAVYADSTMVVQQTHGRQLTERLASSLVTLRAIILLGRHHPFSPVEGDVLTATLC